MPRIPLRTEPYSSPARQQRHFKSKRDRTLKALGSASHINGSQFAIALVNAKGDVECYASELFKSKLGDWFDDSMRHEARELVLQHKINIANNNAASGGAGGGATVQVEMTQGAGGGVFTMSGSALAFGDSPSPSFDPSFSFEESSGGFAHPSKPLRGFPNLAPIDPTLANHAFRTYSDGTLSDIASSISLTSLTPSTGDTAHSFASSGTSALDEWFCNKFHLLQQTTCKLVAKCWIKVIEPKKQIRYPYQRGDESKPDWWPSSLRHKEPDHLLKHERNSLLLAIMSSGRVPVSRLELSTAEAVAHIQPDKMSILREIYEVAKERESRRQDLGHSYPPISPGSAGSVSVQEGPILDDEGSSVSSNSSIHPSALGKRRRDDDEDVQDHTRENQIRRIEQLKPPSFNTRGQQRPETAPASTSSTLTLRRPQGRASLTNSRSSSGSPFYLGPPLAPSGMRRESSMTNLGRWAHPSSTTNANREPITTSFLSTAALPNTQPNRNSLPDFRLQPLHIGGAGYPLPSPFQGQSQLMPLSIAPQALFNPQFGTYSPTSPSEHDMQSGSWASSLEDIVSKSSESISNQASGDHGGDDSASRSLIFSSYHPDQQTHQSWARSFSLSDILPQRSSPPSPPDTDHLSNLIDSSQCGGEIPPVPENSISSVISWL